MGILNVTPDSFSDGGLHHTAEAALEHARRMISEGADIIDIGGESTRPGATAVAPEEELRRTIPVIRSLRQEHPHLRISIDTRHTVVAREALKEGADIVNDITGLADPMMRALCAAEPCGIILMHMQGSPRTMQEAPQYGNVVREVRDFFKNRVAAAEEDGIAPGRICLDPGIGFGKNLHHNLELIRHLEDLRIGAMPIMMALSRKSFMGLLLNNRDLPKKSPIPTVVMSLLAADRGADAHRVHDVAELKTALSLRFSVGQARSSSRDDVPIG